MDLIDDAHIDAYFEKFTLRQTIMIPLVVFAVSLLILAGTTLSIGAPVKLGMEFLGGSAITIDTGDSIESLQQAFSDYPLHSVRSS